MFLVSVAIWYATWPMLLAMGVEMMPLKECHMLLMHNANVLFVLTEVALPLGLCV